MTPDIKIKDFYLQFIHNAKEDNRTYTKKLEEVLNIKKELLQQLKDIANNIMLCYRIDINKFDEVINERYDKQERLYRQAFPYSRTNSENKKYIIIVLKYCAIIKREHELINNVEISNIKQNLTFTKYKNYIADYYNKVHECVLKGMGYKYDGGIGTYVIHRWTRINKKPIVDFAATNAKKKELISKGLKPYDDKEAAWYEARRIPYDGVHYKVYRHDSDWYEFTFMQSKIFKTKLLDYKRIEYLNSKYRGMSYKEIADKFCNTIEDIYKLQVDIKYKLNMILYKDPSKYLNYVRNPEQNRTKYRGDNRKNR